jgi:hypothetical protein
MGSGAALRWGRLGRRLPSGCVDCDGQAADYKQKVPAVRGGPPRRPYSTTTSKFVS